MYYIDVQFQVSGGRAGCAQRFVFVTGKMITVRICLRDWRLVPEIRATTSLGFKYFHTRPSPSPRERGEGQGAARYLELHQTVNHHINIKLINSNLLQVAIIFSFHQHLLCSTFTKYCSGSCSRNVFLKPFLTLKRVESYFNIESVKEEARSPSIKKKLRYAGDVNLTLCNY